MDLTQYFPTIVAALAIIVAALLGGYLNLRTKVSEFRQSWIREQREDIAKYIEVARRWYWKYEEINELESSSERQRLENRDLFPITNEALVILWRIRLRLNPKRTNDSAEDSRFYESLQHLIDPGKVGLNGRLSWERHADEALTKGQEILKREWDRAKGTSWCKLKKRTTQS